MAETNENKDMDIFSSSGKIPVIICLSSFLSGVNSWAYELRTAFHGHPRYQLQLLHLSEDPDRNCDLSARTIEEAHLLLSGMAPAVIVPNYLWDLFPVCLQEGVHSIGICHADTEEEYYRPLSWYEPLISKFIAVSSDCAAGLARRIPNRVEDITVIPCGVFIPESMERTYQVAPIRLVYGGRIVTLQKRVMDFVPLVENLLKRRVDFVFDIVGEGGELPALSKAMKKVAPNERVRFHSRVPSQEMPGIWSNHDVFLQVSDFEGTSVAMLEAMARGAVPVVTDTSGVKDVITDGENGFVVSVGAMEAMAELIARLASDQDRMAAMGLAAHESAKQFSIQSYVRKFSEVVDQVLSSPPARWPHERFRVPQEDMENLSGEEVSRRLTLRRIFQAACYKIAARPGFGWLYRFRGLAGKLLG